MKYLHTAKTSRRQIQSSDELAREGSSAVKSDLWLIGRKEWISLPGLGVGPIHAKIDSGARSSSLHVEYLEEYQENGESWVAFAVENYQGEIIECRLPLEGRRHVKSSSGDGSHRVFVETEARLADRFSWKILISLTDRSSMKHPMLIGRRALSGRFLVDCQRSHYFGDIR